MNVPSVVRRAPAISSRPDEDTRRPGAGASVLRATLLVLFLLSVYVEVPLYLGGTADALFVPSFFTLLILAPVLLLIYHRRIYAYEVVFIVQVALVLALSAVLSPGLIYMNEKVIGLLQTLASVTAGLLMLKLLGDLGRRWVEWVLAGLCALLLVGAILEVAGILRPASDAFREAAFGRIESGIYSADFRDREITGFVRPKFFTTEPSLLAIGFLVFVNSWLVLTYNKKRLVLAGLGTGMMLVLTGSPVILLSVMVSLAIAWFKKPSVFSLAFICALVCTASLVFAFVQPETFSSLTTRVGDSVENLGTLKTTSENRRVVFPYVTLVDVLQRAPLFGAGISGKEMIESYSRLQIDPKYALGNNVLAMFVIYLGLGGATLFGKTLFDYWRRAGVGNITLLLVLILALSQTMGGFETPRFWGYVFLFTGVVKMSSGLRSTVKAPRAKDAVLHRFRLADEQISGHPGAATAHKRSGDEVVHEKGSG